MKKNLRRASKTLNHPHRNAMGPAGHHGNHSPIPRERGAHAETGVPVKLFITDGDEIARVGVRTILDHAEHIEVVGEADTMAAAIEATRRLTPDVILMELRLPDGSGIDACRHIREVSPDTKVLILTHDPDDKSIISVLQAGATGCVFKTITGQNLVRAIECTAKGQSILDPAVTQQVIVHLCNHSVSTCGEIQPSLSAQEERVMERVVEGKTNKEIALLLGLSDKTVKNYLSNAYEKLHVHRRAEATSCFLRHSSNTASAKPG